MGSRKVMYKLNGDWSCGMRDDNRGGYMQRSKGLVRFVLMAPRHRMMEQLPVFTGGVVELLSRVRMFGIPLSPADRAEHPPTRVGDGFC